MSHAVRPNDLRSCTEGAAYVEFLIAFLPIFIMFLGMLQGALIYGGNLVVTHAANRAARAAIVVLDDVEDEYDGEERNVVSFDGSGSSSPIDLGSLGIPPIGAGSGAGSARLKAIRTAASIPLLGIAPSTDQLIGDRQVFTALGGRPEARAGSGVLYNKGALAVTFPTRPGANTYKTTFGPNEDVTVRVTYLFHCGIPLAARWMCDDTLSLITGFPRAQTEDLNAAVASGASPDVINEHVRRLRHATERLNRAQPGRNELLTTEVPALAAATIITGSRFVILRAEATLRNHGARYEYE